jgi:ATP-binding cassette subfamily G (WHITE) protein 2 (SNQ2)
MVYFGPADQARDYFLSLGYVPQAERQTTPDFIVSVTDPSGRVIRPGLTPAEDQVRPRTSAELAARFLASPLMETNRVDIAAYNEECIPGQKDRVQHYERSARAEHAKGTRNASFVFVFGDRESSLCFDQAVHSLNSYAGEGSDAASCTNHPRLEDRHYH